MTPIPRDPRMSWLWGAVGLILLLAFGRLWWLPAQAPLNINEGWNAGHVARAFGAGPLYPAPDALIANNYPPLSFFVVGLATNLFGDTIQTGRIVSVLSEIAVGMGVFAVVRRLSGDRMWAVASATLFALFATTLLRSYTAMYDPQWMAHAATVGALVLLVPRASNGRPAASAIILAAALTVAGLLIKHNLVAIPFAATLWLLLTDRRAFAIWAVAGLTFAAGAGGALYAIWGADVFLDVLAPARSYSFLRMVAHGVPLLLFALPGLLAARPLLASRRNDPRLLLPVLMLAVALPTALLQRSGDGVDINATFETVISLSVAVPVACARRARPWAWFALATLPALALAPLGLIATVREVAGRDAAEARWRPFIDRVATTRGPVACDDQALCYWARRRSALDFFAMKQRLLKGDVPRFREALDRRHFALIAMRGENPGWHENRLIPAVRARYRTIYADNGYELLVPR